MMQQTVDRLLSDVGLDDTVQSATCFVLDVRSEVASQLDRSLDLLLITDNSKCRLFAVLLPSSPFDIAHVFSM